LGHFSLAFQKISEVFYAIPSIAVMLHEFPDLQWLKRRTGQVAGPLPEPGGKDAVVPWPTCLLNVTTPQAARPDVRGPLSLFTNLSGESYAGVGPQRVRVDEQCYFISNPDEHYTLEIDSVQPIQTFNIHFGQHFTTGFYDSLVLPAGQLLESDPAQPGRPVAFFNKLYRRDEAFNALLHAIHQSHRAGTNALLLDEQLSALLKHLLREHRHLEKELRKLPPVKQSTRLEIYRRLSRAADYLYTHHDRNLSLDELAGVACLSKFHFLRLFKIAFGRSPHQFLIGIRLEKARQLLGSSPLPIADLALRVGFPDPSSFSRAFYQAHRVYPTAYRSRVAK
jgi:AraC family transcriptional regulator